MVCAEFFDSATANSQGSEMIACLAYIVLMIRQ